MTTALLIALWSYLYTVPLSEAGQVFGWLKKRLYSLPDWLFKPLIGCARCHSFWVSVGVMTYQRDFDIRIPILAVGFAHGLMQLDLIIEKYLNK